MRTFSDHITEAQEREEERREQEWLEKSSKGIEVESEIRLDCITEGDLCALGGVTYRNW